MAEKYREDELHIREAKKEDMTAVAEMIQVSTDYYYCFISRT